MFKQNYEDRAFKTASENSKVNTICQVVRNSILNSTNLKALFPAVISCYVMESPKRVAESLKAMQTQALKGF